MKTAIYPGSFSPWHKGHEDVLNKALKIFDIVNIVLMENPEKASRFCKVGERLSKILRENDQVKLLLTSDPTLKMVVDKIKPNAIIRGLRNGDDLQYEMNQQYWNEDVGVQVPFVYFITDRSLSHVSSSAIKMVNKLGLKHEYV